MSLSHAVLFDLGDTLIDFGPFDRDALFSDATRETYDALIALHPALPPFERYKRFHSRAIQRAYLWARLRRREFNSLTVLTRLARRLNLPTDEQAMLDLAWRWYLPLHRLASLADDVIPTLTKLRDAGVQLGIVSNTFIAGKIHDRHLEELGLLQFFPTRIYSSELGIPKPNRRIFQAALDAMQVKAQQTFFVGDLIETDMVGAARLGMTTVWKPRSWLERPSEKPRMVGHVITQLSELPMLMLGEEGQLPRTH